MTGTGPFLDRLKEIGLLGEKGRIRARKGTLKYDTNRIPSPVQIISEPISTFTVRFLKLKPAIHQPVILDLP